ncbi:MAG TPA: type II secretion system protein [Verrucomicrobiae bacterium]|jgi:prepilin-type N-terminal cleavage/methylation domain-containing protein|nr:type II secretion system protein [Verrucomicrobiae bacterium]
MMTLTALRMPARRPDSQKQAGFTIVELMIATAILSTILVLVTIMMISIGNLYYKGINQSRVQDDARSISDELSQHLELNDQFQGPTSQSYGGFTVQAYCIGNVRYSYVIGTQLGTSAGQIAHVLWRDTDSTGDCLPQNLTLATPTSSPDTGTELISPDSRLISFSITRAAATDPYVIAVGVAYGGDDLLCSPSAPGSTCNTPATMSAAYFQNGDLLCKGNIGDQFCATASLNTTVVQRISGS